MTIDTRIMAGRARAAMEAGAGLWTEFWSGRSVRERGLLAVAAAGLALSLAWFGAVAPVLDGRARALRAHDAALATARQMQAGAREAALLRLAAPDPAAASAGTGEPVRAAASALARDMGLQIARIQPGEAGSVAFVFDAADPADLFRWIDRVQADYGASLSMVTINRADAGRETSGRAVQASVLVAEAQ